jgi:hypothetical protein
LSGILTSYPIDCGTYEWAVDSGYFSPQREDQRSAEFIQQFSSAALVIFAVQLPTDYPRNPRHAARKSGIRRKIPPSRDE